MEEEIHREKTKTRNLQRVIDDLNAANDTLARDNTSLRGQRRPVRDTLLGAGRRMHLRNNSPHDDLDSIGTEGFFLHCSLNSKIIAVNNSSLKFGVM